MPMLVTVVLSLLSLHGGIAQLQGDCQDHLNVGTCSPVSASSMTQRQSRLALSSDPDRRPDLRPATPAEYSQGFHCHEALEEWRRGWSMQKKEWCCENHGIACEMLSGLGNHLPVTTGEAVDAQMAFEGVMDVIVEVDTANVSHAGTTTGASMAFQIEEDWTRDLDLCSKVTNGEVVARMVRLPAWPTKMRITALGHNAWGYTSIYLYHTNKKNNTVKITVLNGTRWNVTQRGNSSRYWVDGQGPFPKENMYLVPPLPEKYSDQQHCTTRDDPRISSWGYTTSAEGTECIFGVDERDEGNHCIQEEDDSYGSFGWCYTSTDKGSWGSCSANCPLSGQSKILGTKIDEVLRRLNSLKDLHRLAPTTSIAATTTSTQGSTTTSMRRSTTGSNTTTAIAASS
eukprot:TRINITY_DN1044_c0_g1_i4.p1 TRINITY_DN1044_c0_g1~~TRINITY_DN1044_c0_g1_i4.p1  ORF type:complete len:399 (+),score=49.06 TRINITY_DN1044_c0_g1_i4:93-1289(+)